MQPKHVIRVLHAYSRVAKPVFRAGHGPWIKWPEEQLTTLGFARGDSVVLSADAISDDAALERASVVIMNEWVTDEPESASWLILRGSPCDLLQLANGPAHYEIFSLRRDSEGIALHLDAKRAASLLGEPRRADMRLAFLRPNAPIRISVNGKYDYRTQRTYIHTGYIFEYLGEFTRFELRPAVDAAAVIAVPLERAKHVDLTARLY